MLGNKIANEICIQDNEIVYQNKFTPHFYLYHFNTFILITAGGDFPGLCDQKRLYKYVSDFGRLRSCGRLKLRIEGNDY